MAHDKRFYLDLPLKKTQLVFLGPSGRVEVRMQLGNVDLHVEEAEELAEELPGLIDMWAGALGDGKMLEGQLMKVLLHTARELAFASPFEMRLIAQQLPKEFSRAAGDDHYPAFPSEP